jgi:hypothetical protein
VIYRAGSDYIECTRQLWKERDNKCHRRRSGGKRGGCSKQHPLSIIRERDRERRDKRKESFHRRKATSRRLGPETCQPVKSTVQCTLDSRASFNLHYCSPSLILSLFLNRPPKNPSCPAAPTKSHQRRFPSSHSTASLIEFREEREGKKVEIHYTG